MAMNWGSHLISHWQMFRHLVDGDMESADSTKRFYDEYRSVCDMTAEFYLQTIDVVFQRHLLPKGEMKHRGRAVDPGAITDVAILAIEGERDDISGIGQTKAALNIATSLPEPFKKYYHGQIGRPLRHLQRPPLARTDRPGAGRLDRRPRGEGLI
jgi:poly(3-hydroxybutyrate) depolymerase